MLTDYEIALNRFMPAFKAKAASMLVTRQKMSQQEAAGLLELTQASISKYINRAYSKEVKDNITKIQDSIVEEFVVNIVNSRSTAAQRAMCKACQNYHRFSCSIMVK